LRFSSKSLIFLSVNGLQSRLDGFDSGPARLYQGGKGVIRNGEDADHPRALLGACVPLDLQHAEIDLAYR
jgi:hypothetical protein